MIGREPIIVEQTRKAKYEVRAYSRCNRCGAPPRGLLEVRRLRDCLRELAHQGAVPGMTKSSWSEVRRCSPTIADMLTRIRNANRALHDSASMPTSKMKEEIARILKDEGYSRLRIVEVTDDEGSRSPTGCSSSSSSSPATPSRHHQREAGLHARPPRLRGKDRLPRVLGGLGTAIMSTSVGVITNRQAAERGVGGEVIAFVW